MLKNAGGGVRIFHGQGTVIVATSCGEHFSVWQNVTIGRNPSKLDLDGNDTPTIGNNVNVYTGAIVVGGIHIGDNVNIGAGSVIMKDVPDNCTVVGNPAIIIKKDGEKTHIRL